LVTLLGFKVDDSGRKDYNKGIDQTKQKQQSLTASFLKANVIMSAVSKGIGAAFGFVRDTIIGTTAETERYRIAIGTMMHDQEKANKIIHDLDYSAVSDFYGTANAVGGLQNLVSFGMQAEEASATLTRLGDIALGNTETFSSLSNTMGKVFSKGKAEGIELKQFMLQGVDVIGILSKSTGQSREQIEKLGVSYKDVSKALEIMTSEGGDYYKMLEKQGNALNGIIKQYKSFKLATAEAIGIGINDNLKELLKYILEIGRAGQDSFVNKFVGAIKEVIHWIWQIIIMWKVLGYRLADMGDALAPVKQFFLDLKGAAGDVLTGIMILAVEFGKLIVAAFRPIQAFASPIIKELGAIAKDVFTAIADFIRPLIPMVEGSAGFFGALGQAIAGILRPVLTVALGIKGLTTAFGAFKAAMGVAKTASFIFSGDLAKIAAGMTKLTGSRKFARGVADTFGLLTGKLSVMKKASEGNRVALLMLNAQMLKNKATTIAHAVATKAAAAATKAWDWVKMAAGVVKSTAALVANKIATVAVTVAQKIAAVASKAWAAVQSVLNAIMAANPIGLIIIAVVALIALVIALIKNWDKVKTFFIALGKNISEIFTTVVAKIKTLFSSVIVWIKTAWSAVSGWFARFWEGIVSVAINVWNAFKDWITAFVEAVKSVWSVITRFFSGLWDGIVNTAMAVWDTLKTWFFGLVEGIKTIWNGITGFFSGLWEAIMQGPAEAIEYIKNAFFGLFNSVQEKFFGFISKIKEGWETVKGFFGGIADGVVNFFTGGSGRGGSGQMQPAYAGGTSQAAMAGAVGQTSNYAYNTMGGNSTVNAQTSINVNVPPGTSQEQSEAIARQVDAQFDARLAGSINSSRANIPSPEVRRH
jgi:phage-related protein